MKIFSNILILELKQIYKKAFPMSRKNSRTLIRNYRLLVRRKQKRNRKFAPFLINFYFIHAVVGVGEEGVEEMFIFICNLRVQKFDR